MRRKPVHTRKGRGLRWLAIALGSMLLVSVTGYYPLLPSLVVDQDAQRMGLEHMEVVERRWDRDDWNRVEYLSDSERAVMHTTALWDLSFGWQTADRSPTVLDKKAPDGSLALKCRYHYYKNRGPGKEGITVTLLGFLPDGAPAPTICFGPVADAAYLGAVPLPNSTIAFQGEPQSITPTADIPVSGGSCFFEQIFLPMDREEDWPTIMGAVRHEDGSLTLLRENWSITYD